MAYPRISQNLPPNIDPTKATLAFGNWAPYRFERELPDECLLTRQRSVNALSSYLWDPQNVASCISAGVIPPLIKLLTDEDVTCRQLSAKCCIVLCQCHIGRESFVSMNGLIPLSCLMDDEQAICRINAQKTIENISNVPMGCQAIIDTEFLLPKLILKIASDLDEIKIIALTIVYNCLMIQDDAAHEMMMETDLFKYLMDLMDHPNKEIKKLANGCIGAACMRRPGKRKAVKMDFVQLLLERLTSTTDWRTLSNLAFALANICIITEGKYAAINDFGVEKLFPLLIHSESEVRVNTLKALTCLAEAPEGRDILSRRIGRIEKMLWDVNTGVRKQASTTLKVIKWKP